jgi:hypothetical protein
MKLDQQNTLIRFVLRAIDIFASAYLGRAVHWDKDPLQKATKPEMRCSFFFMALFPPFMWVSMKHSKFLEKGADFVTIGHHSIIWLCAVFGITVGFAVLAIWMIGQRIPVFISAPIALIGWPLIIWWGLHLPFGSLR